MDSTGPTFDVDFVEPPQLVRVKPDNQLPLTVEELEKEVKTTLETTKTENYTQNEWNRKLHSKRVNLKTTLKTSVVSGCP